MGYPLCPRWSCTGSPCLMPHWLAPMLPPTATVGTIPASRIRSSEAPGQHQSSAGWAAPLRWTWFSALLWVHSVAGRCRDHWWLWRVRAMTRDGTWFWETYIRKVGLLFNVLCVPFINNVIFALVTLPKSAGSFADLLILDVAAFRKYFLSIAFPNVGCQFFSLLSKILKLLLFPKWHLLYNIQPYISYLFLKYPCSSTQ